MSRDDEIAVIECRNGGWVVANVGGSNISWVDRTKPLYDNLNTAIAIAEDLDDRCHTEYGVQIYYNSDSDSDSDC